MYKGKLAKGFKFYKLLEKSEEFTSELGKVVLASGKLEAELIIFFGNHNIKGNFERATLGKLIDIAETNNLFENNELQTLKEINKQRNYITHNIYALFIDLKDETIIQKKDLLDSDVHLYIEKAWQLRTNLNSLSAILNKRNKNNI